MSEETKAPQQETPAEAEVKEAPAQETEQAPEENKKGCGCKKKHGEIEVLKAKLEAAEAKVKATEDRLLRTAAEYDNYRKRTTAEKDARFNDGVTFAAAQILDILDTLGMAAAAPCADENYKKGVTMTLDKAARAFETLRIEEIDAMGKPFDPNLMNAVQQLPAQEGQESGQVVQVYQKGYTLNGKVIRHATVVVAE